MIVKKEEWLLNENLNVSRSSLSGVFIINQVSMNETKWSECN